VGRGVLVLVFRGVGKGRESWGKGFKSGWRRARTRDGNGKEGTERKGQR